MELNILHLYPEMMSLYGEYANLKVLRRHLEKLGVTANLQGVPCGETPDFDGVDMVYMGAGTERAAQAAMADFARYGDALKAAAQDCAQQGFRSHDVQYENESALRHGYSHGIGSNLTVFTYNCNTDIAQTAVSHWRYSPGHFQTMIAERYDSIGVGVMLRDDVAYCYMFAGNSNGVNPYA